MVNIVDYIITPVDMWRWLKGLGRLRGLLLVVGCMGVFVAATLGVSGSLLSVVAVVYMAVVLRVDARTPFIGAIILLILIAAVSAFDTSQATNRDSLQNTLAVYAYYCLVLGVLLLIRDQVVPSRIGPVPSASLRHSASPSSSLHTRRRHGVTPPGPRDHQAVKPTQTPVQPSVVPGVSHSKIALHTPARSHPAASGVSQSVVPGDKQYNAPIPPGTHMRYATQPTHATKQARRRNRDARLMDIAPRAPQNVAPPTLVAGGDANGMSPAPQLRPKHSPNISPPTPLHAAHARRLYGRTIQ